MPSALYIYLKSLVGDLMSILSSPHNPAQQAPHSYISTMHSACREGFFCQSPVTVFVKRVFKGLPVISGSPPNI